MLLEQLSYTNRWRRVHPGPKLLFAACGIAAASISSDPAVTLLIACMTVSAALFAGIPPVSYLKVFTLPMLFLACSGATIASRVELHAELPWVAVTFPHEQMLAAARVCSRSAASVTALLFLAFTTPLNDLISLLRRYRCPSILTDLMTLCFRTLFVFSEVVHDVATAQASRMGYSNASNAMRSTGILITALMVQVWQRSLMLHQSALSRANDGPLYFLTPEYPALLTSFTVAFAAGAMLIIMAIALI